MDEWYKTDSRVKAVVNDWYIIKMFTWEISNLDGTDCFSINIHDNIDYEAFARNHSHMNYEELRKFVEHKYHVEKDKMYFLVYAVG